MKFGCLVSVSLYFSTGNVDLVRSDVRDFSLVTSDMKFVSHRLFSIPVCICDWVIWITYHNVPTSSFSSRSLMTTGEIEPMVRVPPTKQCSAFC